MASLIMSENFKPHGNELAQTVRVLFSEGQTDYALEPVVLQDSHENKLGRVQAGDSVVFCCRRGEREIQLTEAFTSVELPQVRQQMLNDLYFVILTLYHEKFKDLPVAFAPAKVEQTLGELVSAAGLSQTRISESEKFAHVTFFLDGGQNQMFPGEKGVRVPSPKGTPFDQIPQLKISEVSDEVIRALKSGDDLIVVNFANGDVIGHTQNRDAKIQCAEYVDAALGKVIQSSKELGYITYVTADHGNLEELYTEDGSPHVSHTSNLVRFLCIDPSDKVTISQDGKLADIAPTILVTMGIKSSPVMTGSNLVQNLDNNSKNKVLLIILDGWGLGQPDDTNPIHIAHTPVWDSLLANTPGCNLYASGESVGLKNGKPGNSEAGHMNIGAGRIVLQDDVRLDNAMKEGTFYKNEILLNAIGRVKNNGKSLHLIGLLTEKSSHGSIDYPLAILKMAKDAGLSRVYLHMILDGRSTEPGSAPMLLELLDRKIQEIGIGQIVSLIGRGIALDRDGNYNRTKQAYDLLVNGVGRVCVLTE